MQVDYRSAAAGSHTVAAAASRRGAVGRPRIERWRSTTRDLRRFGQASDRATASRCVCRAEVITERRRFIPGHIEKQPSDPLQLVDDDAEAESADNRKRASTHAALGRLAVAEPVTETGWGSDAPLYVPVVGGGQTGGRVVIQSVRAARMSGQSAPR